MVIAFTAAGPAAGQGVGRREGPQFEQLPAAGTRHAPGSLDRSRPYPCRFVRATHGDMITQPCKSGLDRTGDTG